MKDLLKIEYLKNIWKYLDIQDNLWSLALNSQHEKFNSKSLINF